MIPAEAVYYYVMGQVVPGLVELLLSSSDLNAMDTHEPRSASWRHKSLAASSKQIR